MIDYTRLFPVFPWLSEHAPMSVVHVIVAARARTANGVPVAGHPSSPLSTGGAGVIFEYDVAAILMSRLLRGASVPVGLHGSIARVAFQQGNEGYPLDDVVAYGHAEGPASAPSIQVQVKRRIKATAGDAEFVKVMGAAVLACDGQPKQIPARRLLFGLAARRSAADHLDELTELTDMARAHKGCETFENLFRAEVTKKPLRDRFEDVSVAVAAAAPDAFAVRQLTHEILRALHVWQVEEGPDGRDWRAELDSLADLADAAGRSPADIMTHLLAIAGRFGPRSGNVDADLVRAELARFEVYLPAARTGLRRPMPHTTIHASGNSTVFNGQVMNFNAVHFHGSPSAPGKENGAS
jgi:hypothetical protein